MKTQARPNPSVEEKDRLEVPSLVEQLFIVDSLWERQSPSFINDKSTSLVEVQTYKIIWTAQIHLDGCRKEIQKRHYVGRVGKSCWNSGRKQAHKTKSQTLMGPF